MSRGLGRGTQGWSSVELGHASAGCGRAAWPLEVLDMDTDNKDTASMSCHLTTASPSLAPPVGTPTSTSTWPWQMGGLQAKHTLGTPKPHLGKSQGLSVEG